MTKKSSRLYSDAWFFNTSKSFSNETSTVTALVPNLAPDKKGTPRQVITRVESINKSVSGSTPSFIIESTGGHFKGRDPTVSTDKLTAKWLDDESVVYVGKAGSRGSKATLRKRLKSYFDFGTGKPVGHWGGRYIWQLAYANDLIVAWKSLGESDPSPSAFETKLLRDFKARCGKLPFANLKC
ncbi:hypothetical protein OVA03_05510 [Asticcacaulis sp. SL142]|uniref:hypothetical protein n=1 Tax=Asticcacaulis sp. SL142 TaxID=2995155 RepID=UPI00226D28BD|nr:hypothetical protein [Asticcacaulis sp. SL142]WAC49365.1 hypothetical protein OVA03_05510 [Asticcacaulis sp. SL142]